MISVKLTKKNERVELVLMRGKSHTSDWSTTAEFNDKYPDRSPIYQDIFGRIINQFTEMGSVNDRLQIRQPKSSIDETRTQIIPDQLKNSPKK